MAPVAIRSLLAFSSANFKTSDPSVSRTLNAQEFAPFLVAHHWAISILSASLS